MSQVGTILETYKETVIAQKEKRYLKAARLYRDSLGIGLKSITN